MLYALWIFGFHYVTFCGVISELNTGVVKNLCAHDVRAQYDYKMKFLSDCVLLNFPSTIPYTFIDMKITHTHTWTPHTLTHTRLCVFFPTTFRNRLSIRRARSFVWVDRTASMRVFSLWHFFLFPFCYYHISNGCCWWAELMYWNRPNSFVFD